MKENTILSLEERSLDGRFRVAVSTRYFQLPMNWTSRAILLVVLVLDRTCQVMLGIDVLETNRRFWCPQQLITVVHTHYSPVISMVSLSILPKSTHFQVMKLWQRCQFTVTVEVFACCYVIQSYLLPTLNWCSYCACSWIVSFSYLLLEKQKWDFFHMNIWYGSTIDYVLTCQRALSGDELTSRVTTCWPEVPNLCALDFK